MLAKELITEDIPSLKMSDTTELAMRWMDEFKIMHLPIVENGEYLGTISDAVLLDLNSPKDPLVLHKLSLMRPFVSEGAHVYEVIKLMTALQLTVLTVLHEDGSYAGCISMQKLVSVFGTLSAVNEPGGIVILEMNEHDYSLSQIAQIVEGNDAKILSLYLKTIEDSTQIEVTLKINKQDLSRILQTFYRYNYTVKASYHQRMFEEDLRDRFDSFMNYINI